MNFLNLSKTILIWVICKKLISELQKTSCFFRFRPGLSDFQLPARSSSGRAIKRPANYQDPDPEDGDEDSENSDADENFVFTFAYDNELDLVMILPTVLQPKSIEASEAHLGFKTNYQ